MISHDPIATMAPSDSFPPVIVIAGPTAVGKTAVAVDLARQINGEIVNADSMQVYSGMNIGTAKPTRRQRDLVRFHLMDIVLPNEQMTVSRWKELAEAAIHDIHRRGALPIVCGGTGLYIRALLDDWSLATTPADPALRSDLEARVQNQGAPALHAELSLIDPASAERLHPNDAVRVIRALEVYYSTGTPISTHQAIDKQSRIPRRATRIGLTVDRVSLKQRIDDRVDGMIRDGLEFEVRSLLDAGYARSLSSMRCLGYNEMVQFISGEISLEQAVNLIKLNTRRYAKRQSTWFRADPGIHWIDVTTLNSAEVAECIKAMVAPAVTACSNTKQRH